MNKRPENLGQNVVDIGRLEERFEELVDFASEGNEIVITKDDQPIAKLVPLQSSHTESSAQR